MYHELRSGKGVSRLIGQLLQVRDGMRRSLDLFYSVLFSMLFTYNAIVNRGMPTDTWEPFENACQVSIQRDSSVERSQRARQKGLLHNATPLR